MSPLSNSARTIQVAAVLLFALGTQVKSNAPQTGSLNRTRPLSFEANQEEAADVQFLLRDSRYTLLLSERNATLSFSQ